MDLGVVCRTCEELPSRIEDWCPIPTQSSHASIMGVTTPSFMAQRNKITCQTAVATTIIATLGAVTGVLLVLLLGTMIALIVTCTVLRR